MQIMDVTLRDGSYAINFGFTATDTEVIGKALDDLGFTLIEVGHGIGLGATLHPEMPSAIASDEEYLKAASQGIQRAKFGVFCIPGIANLNDIDMAIEYGLGFIRIGTNVTEIEEAEPFIKHARERGIYVMANFMKSYVLEPKAFALKAKQAVDYGAEVVYLVDSAGGMLPNNIADYFKAVKDITDAEVGFHGHDNLGLAMANSLVALEEGASIIDTSLQGLGRSAGNTVTEMFVSALSRLGKTQLDPISVMDVGETFVKPLVNRQGHSSVDIVTGLAQFHSSYMKTIQEYASKYRVDPRRLIMAVCEHDKVNAPKELVEQMAKQIQTSEGVYVAKYGLHRYFGNEQNQ